MSEDGPNSRRRAATGPPADGAGRRAGRPCRRRSDLVCYQLPSAIERTDRRVAEQFAVQPVDLKAHGHRTGAGKRNDNHTEPQKSDPDVP
jgi:hypothetical protein